MNSPAERANTFPYGHALNVAALDVDPYPIFRELREHEPVSWIPALGMWFVTRRADVVHVLRNPDTFRTDAPGSTILDTFGPQMLSTEGPVQRKYKHACAPPFNTRAVRERAAPFVTTHVTESIAQLGAQRRVDLRAAFARRVAVASIASVMGLPSDLHDTMLRWYADFAAALANFRRDGEVRARGRASAEAFRQTIAPIVARFADSHDPAEPLLWRLATGGADGLSHDEIASNALIVLFGGIETTESTISNVLWALYTHPEALAEVRAEPALLDRAMEEGIRWEAAVQSCTRHAAEDIELAGVTVRAGEIVQCMLGAANRDPDFFEDPDRFDIHRSNAAEHVSFGSGRHFCLGAALAREEVRISVSALIDAFPNLALDPDRPSAPFGSEFRAPPTLFALCHGS
jgi:cytochrome P450